MKFIEAINLKNKYFKVYKINQWEVNIFKKLHLEILNNIPLKFDYPYNYKLFKEGIRNNNDHIFIMFFKNKPIAYSYINFPKFNLKDIDYTKRYKISEDKLSFVCEIDGVGVISKYRGIGIQNYFFKLREKFAKENNKKYLYVSVYPENKYSLDNIKQNGFKKIYSYKNKNGHSRWYFFKEI